MFLNHAEVVDYKPNEWVLLRPLVWQDGAFVIEVPARFVTDLASIPGVLRGLPAFNPNGLSRRPAILHDFAYCSHCVPTRADADQLLFDALLSAGVSRAVARAYWLGVRAGGWLYWNERRKRGGLNDHEDFVTPEEFTQLSGPV